MTENRTSIDLKKTGLKIKQFAGEQGYSVKDIQKYLCLSCPQPVYRWYKGIILPSVDHLLRLSELFHVHMEELLVKKQDQIVYIEISYSINSRSGFVRRIQEYRKRLAA